ncbi:hypothetical protein [Viridibacterium curvum]|uniref:Uncharacterized protein n=1 Tax=Viridibacterium curvum TaxID=1101404 RepID=A0ABP9QLI7_9RHOO
MPKSSSRLQASLLPAACFVAGLCGLFTLAGLGSGKLDITLLLPLVLAVLSLFLTRADQHFQGPGWILPAFGLFGLLEMPVFPLLALSGQSGLLLDGVLPGIVRMALVVLFCIVALLSRKSTKGASA